MLGTEVFPIQGPISGCGGLSATEAFLADRTTYYTWYHGMTGYWHHHIDITSTHDLPECRSISLSVCNAVHGGSQGRRRPTGLKVVPACC